MDEKEAVARLEQQLQDSVRNQSLILADLKEIFAKVDNISKDNASVKASLNLHIETEAVKKQRVDERLVAIEERLKESKKEFSDFIEDFKKQNDLKLLVIEKDITDLKTFTLSVKNTLNLIKIAAGFIVLVVTAVWPIVLFFLTKGHPG